MGVELVRREIVPPSSPFASTAKNGGTELRGSTTADDFHHFFLLFPLNYYTYKEHGARQESNLNAPIYGFDSAYV